MPTLKSLHQLDRTMRDLSKTQTKMKKKMTSTTKRNCSKSTLHSTKMMEKESSYLVLRWWQRSPTYEIRRSTPGRARKSKSFQRTTCYTISSKKQLRLYVTQHFCLTSSKIQRLLQQLTILNQWALMLRAQALRTIWLEQRLVAVPWCQWWRKSLCQLCKTPPATIPKNSPWTLRALKPRKSAWATRSTLEAKNQDLTCPRTCRGKETRSFTRSCWTRSSQPLMRSFTCREISSMISYLGSKRPSLFQIGTWYRRPVLWKRTVRSMHTKTG